MKCTPKRKIEIKWSKVTDAKIYISDMALFSIRTMETTKTAYYGYPVTCTVDDISIFKLIL